MILVSDFGSWAFRAIDRLAFTIRIKVAAAPSRHSDMPYADAETNFIEKSTGIIATTEAAAANDSIAAFA